MIEIFEHAENLPHDWDSVVGNNIYMKKDFLCFIERVDKCQQRYYLIRNEQGAVDTIFMTYVRNKYNLAMFAKFPMIVKMTFIYVPLSVTRPGIIYNKHLNEALGYIKAIKGYKIILNLGDNQFEGFAKGLTCPKCIMQVRWNSFDEYMQSLRSGYRYRYNNALKKSKELNLRFLKDGSEFTDEMYDLYLQVYNNSTTKIEKLSKSFFQGEFFKIYVLENKEGVQGFIQLLPNGDELIFEFVGFNHENNRKYDTYMRMLLEIVRYGIDNGFKTIDFGQTADDAKLKLGSQYNYLYAYLHNSNPIVNKVCNFLAPKLEYKPLKTPFKVFKEEP